MHIVIFVTCTNLKEARLISRALLKERLVACVNIIGKIESLFWWKGKIDNSKEFLLIIKSKKSRLGKIIKLVRSKHSYEVPEIIALPIVSGEKSYLRWLDESVK